MKKLLIILLVVASPAMAQEVTLKVNNAELDLIGKGLGTQPFNDVAPLLQKLQAQVIEQKKAAEAKPDANANPALPNQPK